MADHLKTKKMCKHYLLRYVIYVSITFSIKIQI